MSTSDSAVCQAGQGRAKGVADWPQPQGLRGDWSTGLETGDRTEMDGRTAGIDRGAGGRQGGELRRGGGDKVNVSSSADAAECRVQGAECRMQPAGRQARQGEDSEEGGCAEMLRTLGVAIGWEFWFWGLAEVLPNGARRDAASQKWDRTPRTAPTIPTATWASQQPRTAAARALQGSPPGQTHAVVRCGCGVRLCGVGAD
jgi:hypothetical protein